MLKFPIIINSDMTPDDANPILEGLRAAIMQTTNESLYDHRGGIPVHVRSMFPHMMEDNQLQYARFKMAVAEVLKPKNIYEVGTGWGVSAKAFSVGNPDALIHGIDNAEMGVPPMDVMFDIPNATYEYADTDNLTAFVHPAGPIDLIHIDGGHGRAHKARDIVKALQARPSWILVDDIHDVMVSAGTFDGLYQAAANPLRMLCFENSHTGNLLIWANRREAVVRT